VSAIRVNNDKIRSIFNGAGYFTNDNRASGGKLEEDDLVGCSHCQAAVRKAEWRMQGGYCRECDSPLCVTCAGTAVKFGCSNFKKLVETRWEVLQRG
jgi:hypothetical protein